MPLIRPEVSAALWRAREVIAALGAGSVGLWLIWLGGYLLAPVGMIVLVFAAVWMVTALRRMRFAQAVMAPGVVEVDEAQIGYMGPSFGGYVALPELTELRLVTMYGRRMWRLKQDDGQALLIPVDAAGAERLFDAFASLPGMDMAHLMAVLNAPVAAGRAGLPVVRDAGPGPVAKMDVIWRRQGLVARGP
jgi:hypothetical protein